MIRVARFIPFFSGQYGGPVTHIVELTKYLDRSSIATTIYTSSEINYSANRITYPYQKLNTNFIIKRFNSFIRFKDYRISIGLFSSLIKDSPNIDIFHSHAIRSFQEDIGSIVALVKKKPLIITPHGAISLNWVHGDLIPKMMHDKTIGFLKRKLLNPHFIAVAKNEIPIIRSYGIDENHIHYISHGVNTEIFKPVDSNALKIKYNLENFDVLLYVGRIAKGKGLDKLIKILRLIVEKKKNVKLIIVGVDSGFIQVIKSLIQKYVLSKYVIFTGYILRKDLPKYYSLADLIIYPSRKEIFGHVITEAGACGKPVIGSDIMGPSEIIVNGQTGYLSNFESTKEISDLILELLNDKSRLFKIGNNARKRVIKEYSWKKSAEAHVNLYKNILNLN